MYEGWTGTEVACKAGDTLEISARGEFTFGSAEGEVVGPEGFANGEQEEDRAFPDDPTAALMGSLGQTTTPFLVGLEHSYRCESDGELRVCPNDRSPGDNVGWLQVEVIRIPAE